MIAVPPLSAGAVHETVIFPSNGFATVKVNPVGIPGLVAKTNGVALTVAPSPLLECAWTRQVYSLPLLNPADGTVTRYWSSSEVCPVIETEFQLSEPATLH